LKLVMATKPWGFRVKHIPGSLYFKTPEQMFAALDKNDDIVVYCSNVDCRASLATIQKLLDHGYLHVSHYAGGLIDWETAGLPLDRSIGVVAGPRLGHGARLVQAALQARAHLAPLAAQLRPELLQNQLGKRLYVAHRILLPSQDEARSISAARSVRLNFRHAM